MAGRSTWLWRPSTPPRSWRDLPHAQHAALGGRHFRGQVHRAQHLVALPDVCGGNLSLPALAGGEARHEDERDEDGGDDDQLTAFHGGRIIAADNLDGCNFSYAARTRTSAHAARTFQCPRRLDA